MKHGKGGKALLKGMTDRSPKGDGIARPPSGSVDANPTRDKVARGHTIGGRVA